MTSNQSSVNPFGDLFEHGRPFEREQDAEARTTHSFGPSDLSVSASAVNLDLDPADLPPAELETLAQQQALAPSPLQLEPPPDTDIPQRGMAGFRARRNMRLNKPGPDGYLRVPQPGKKEQEEFDRQAFLRKEQFLIDLLRWLANTGLQPTITTLNINGKASKSTTAVVLGSVIAEYTRRVTLLLPATAATSNSSVSLMTGIRSVTVDELAHNIKRRVSFRELWQGVPGETRGIPKNNAGLGIVSELGMDDSDINDRNPYGLQEFDLVVDTLLPNVEALILDTGNDKIQWDCIPLDAARRATTLLFAANAELPITVNFASMTMARYMADKEPCYTAEQAQACPARQIPTPDKVRNSLVVVNKVPSGAEHEVDELLQQSHYMPDFRGQSFNIPPDPALENLGVKRNGILKSFDFRALSPHTHMQFLRLAVHSYIATAAVQRFDFAPCNPPAEVAAYLYKYMPAPVVEEQPTPPLNLSMDLGGSYGPSHN